MKRLLSVCVFLSLVLSFPFASPQKEEPAALQKEAAPEILVSAAASLTNCLQEIGEIYNRRPDTARVVFNFGSSGALQQQIEQGAPADIFFSAGKKQMQALQDKGLMDDATVRFLLENKVVLIVPKGAVRPGSFEDLRDPRYGRIAIGAPDSVPAGQYAEQVLISLGLREALEDRLILAKDVREVLFWVESGNADAGMVYSTDALISTGVEVCLTAPGGSHTPVRYPAGVTSGSGAPGAASDFLDFLLTPEVREIFLRYGFTPAE